MNTFSAEVKGLPELLARFKRLATDDLGQKTLRGAVSAGASVVRAAEKRATPVAARPVRRGGGVVTPPGTMQRAAVIKYDRASSNETQAVYVVAYRQGKRAAKKSRDAFYAQWVDRGHLIVPRRKKKATRGQLAGNRVRASAAGRRVAGRNFFVPTFESTRQQAIDAMVRRLRLRLSKAGV